MIFGALRAHLRPGPTFGFAVLLLTSAPLVGCDDDTLAAQGYVTPTTISVDPTAFLGNVPCSTQPGAMRAFVATITDRTTGFTLASSPPTACNAPAGFHFVTHGHEYTAEVDGYEQAAEELFPVGGRHTGSRTIRDADGDAIEPRWTTACGEGADGAATARFNTVVTVRGCEPLQDHAPSDVTAISVDVSSTIGDLGCTSEGGSVDVVEVSGPELPTVLVACDGPPVVYSSGIEPGRFYELAVLAHPPEGEDGGPWGASCHAIAEAGLEVAARCDALDDDGGIEVAIDSLLSEQGATCAEDVSSFAVTFEADDLVVESGRVACTDSVRLGPLPAGDYGGNLEATDADGEVVFSAACAASVEPGRVATALCSIIPTP